MDRGLSGGTGEEVGENEEVDVKSRALRSPDGDRIMASRHYDRVSDPRFFLSFDIWGIEKHDPTGWMRMQFIFLRSIMYYIGSGSQNGR